MKHLFTKVLFHLHFGDVAPTRTTCDGPCLPEPTFEEDKMIIKFFALTCLSPRNI